MSWAAARSWIFFIRHQFKLFGRRYFCEPVKFFAGDVRRVKFEPGQTSRFYFGPNMDGVKGADYYFLEAEAGQWLRVLMESGDHVGFFHIALCDDELRATTHITDGDAREYAGRVDVAGFYRIYAVMPVDAGFTGYGLTIELRSIEGAQA
jgi:hypothetical protein